MTSDIERTKKSELISGLVKIHKKRVGGKSLAEQNHPSEIQSRNKEYADFIEPYLKSCEHFECLNLPELKRKRSETICHIADVIVRSTLEEIDEKSITLDDVLCLAVGVQLKSLDPKRTETQAALSYIPASILSDEDELGIVDRFVEYYMNYIPETYTRDNPAKFEMVLRRQLTDIEYSSVRNLAVVLAGNTNSNNIAKNCERIKIRMQSSRIEESRGLAVLTVIGNVYQTLSASDAYDVYYSILFNANSYTSTPNPAEAFK